MGWPHSQDYNEAIQSPARNFADADLRAGQAAANAFGIPMPCSGNFADVYQVRCPDGSRWAVKCFTRECPGLRERYQEISAHLRRVRLPFIVDFTYLEPGIRVAGQWYPVLKMEWVEGLTLNQFVARAADKPATLEALLRIWARMARHLRAAEVAHADLQHGNVLLVPEAGAKSLSLKLVDYDGLWVPSLAGRPSGEVGHGAYQHPQRHREGTYSLEVDRFPVLLVATALSALKAQGRALWERYDNGDNLLFTQQDLEAPSKSRLFYKLLKLDDPAARSLAERLIEAARRPLEEAPLLEDLMPGHRPAPAEPAEESAPSPEAQVAEVMAASAPRPGELPDADYLAERRRRFSASLRIAATVGAAVALLAVLVLVIVLTGSGSGGDSKKGQALARGDEPAASRKGRAPSRGDGLADSKKGLTPGDGAAGPKRPEPLPDRFTNGLGMEFVLVPKGKSWLGGGGGKPGDKEVNIPHDFYLGKYEVTQQEWQNVMGSNPSEFKAVAGVSKEDQERFPVEMVSWHDAQAFLTKLNERDTQPGWVYRLPKEAEWEYACRGGPMTDKADSAFNYYFTRPTDQLLPEQANVNRPDGLKRTCKVGSYPPNPLGLYDMHGNVWEWCDDAQVGRESLRIMRGGACSAMPEGCSAANRPDREPSARHSDGGLRVARVPLGNP
jgi:formylglycine-generating enzyme required for sulfatase activity